MQKEISLTQQLMEEEEEEEEVLQGQGGTLLKGLSPEQQEQEEEEEEVVDASELAQVMREQFAQSDGAQQAILAEVAAQATGIAGSIRRTLRSIRLFANLADMNLNKVPDLKQVKSKLQW